MRLVHHDHDVAPVAQRLVAVGELLHGREHDAVGLAALQQALQVLAAGSLHGCLAQKRRASTELAEELVVQVVSVGDDHDGRAVQVALQQVREEHHRKRLAGALRVPEHADLAVARHGLLGALDGLAHAEVLVVGGEDLHGPVIAVVEADEVLDQVEQARLGHHAVEHRLPGRRLGLGVVAVGRLPRHVAVLVGGDGSHAGLGHVAHHAESVRDEQAGDVVHVVAQLQVGVGGVCLLTRGRLQLEDDQRHTVHEGDDVRALLGVLDERPLVHDVEVVVFRVVEIEQPHDVVALLLAVEEAHLHARLQVVGEGLVALLERAALDVLDLEDSLVDGRRGKPLIDARKGVFQDSRQEHIAVLV